MNARGSLCKTYRFAVLTLGIQDALMGDPLVKRIIHGLPLCAYGRLIISHERWLVSIYPSLATRRKPMGAHGSSAQVHESQENTHGGLW